MLCVVAFECVFIFCLFSLHIKTTICRMFVLCFCCCCCEQMKCSEEQMFIPTARVQCKFHKIPLYVYDYVLLVCILHLTAFAVCVHSVFLLVLSLYILCLTAFAVCVHSVFLLVLPLYILCLTACAVCVHSMSSCLCCLCTFYVLLHVLSVYILCLPACAVFVHSMSYCMCCLCTFCVFLLMLSMYILCLACLYVPSVCILGLTVVVINSLPRFGKETCGMSSVALWDGPAIYCLEWFGWFRYHISALKGV